MKTKNIRGQVKQKIKEYFFKNPTVRLRVRQIERTLNIPLPSVIRYAKELEKEEILGSEKISEVKFFSADRSNFLIEKKLYNLKFLYDSGLIKYLIGKYSDPTIILFGSYSKGEDTEHSDIDIYIETPSKEEINLDEFKKILNKNIQAFIHKTINEIGNKELINNIINGITLNGFLEIYNGKNK